MIDANPDSASLPTEYVTVDGIEGKYARVELPDGTTTDWLLSTLPEGVQEGDVLAVSGEGGDFDLAVDRAETKKRKRQAQSKLEALNQVAQKGYITL